MRLTETRLLLLLAAGLGGARGAAAQAATDGSRVQTAVAPATSPSATEPAPPSIPVSLRPPGWQQLGLATLGVAALFSLDEPVRALLQGHRGPGLDGVAKGARQLGEWKVQLALPVALAAAGAIAGDAELLRVSRDVGASVMATGILVDALKRGFGRARPHCQCGPMAFDPMGSGRSLPSGHTAGAFAAATAIAAHTRSGWARAGLYGAASLVAWSRMNDNKHWLSDVAAGALVGMGTAHVVTRRLGGRAVRPEVGPMSQGTAIGVSVAF